MQTVQVSDAIDPALAAMWNLRDAEALHGRGQFIAEGRFVVGRVLEDPRYVVRALLLNHASRRALEPLIAQSTFDGTVYICETSAFERVTGFDIHRGCLALVDRPPAQTWREALGIGTRVVVLEAVGDANNVGAVFRNAAAFGASAVLLSPTCCDPLYRKAIRASMGLALRVPFARLSPWPTALHELRAGGFTVAAASPREPACPLDRFSRQYAGRPLALVFGTEGAGLSTACEAEADLRVRIPISPDVDSLNVAVASGIILSALFAEHRSVTDK